MWPNIASKAKRSPVDQGPSFLLGTHSVCTENSHRWDMRSAGYLSCTMETKDPLVMQAIGLWHCKPITQGVFLSKADSIKEMVSHLLKGDQNQHMLLHLGQVQTGNIQDFILCRGDVQKGCKPFLEVPNQSCRYLDTRTNKTSQAAMDYHLKADGYQCTLITNEAMVLPRTWSLFTVFQYCTTKN